MIDYALLGKLAVWVVISFFVITAFRNWLVSPPRVRWDREEEERLEQATFAALYNRDVSYIDPTYADFEARPFALDVPDDPRAA